MSVTVRFPNGLYREVSCLEAMRLERAGRAYGLGASAHRCRTDWNGTHRSLDSWLTRWLAEGGPWRA